MSEKAKVPKSTVQQLINFELVADRAPQPFLRWAGGKRRLTSLLIDSFPTNFDPLQNIFYEPFVGGGALTFATGNPSSDFFIPGKNIVINDSNPDLITTYKVIQNDVNKLIESLKGKSTKKSQKHFEAMKNYTPENDIEVASRFIYLNKTCFNGLWRVNSKGQFNVPWGKLKKPQILNAENLVACHFRLRKAKIKCGDFENAVARAKAGDLVYFDPPYIPLSSSSSFSQYSKENFGLKEHENLAKLIEQLTKKGVYVIMSNSDTPMTRDIFEKVLTLRQISMTRSISAASSSRIQVNEILGANFKLNERALIGKLTLISKIRKELR